MTGANAQASSALTLELMRGGVATNAVGEPGHPDSDSVVGLGKLGCLGPRSRSGACWVDDEEIPLLAEHGTGVSHNQWRTRSGQVGARRSRRRSLPGSASTGRRNNGQDMSDTAKMAVYFPSPTRIGSPRRLRARLLLIGGERALHLEDRIGSLEPGNQADLICVDIDHETLTPRQTVIANLVYANDRSAARLRRGRV